MSGGSRLEILEVLRLASWLWSPYIAAELNWRIVAESKSAFNKRGFVYGFLARGTVLTWP